jgi:hypothetical protein
MKLDRINKEYIGGWKNNTTVDCAESLELPDAICSFMGVSDHPADGPD